MNRKRRRKRRIRGIIRFLITIALLALTAVFVFLLINKIRNTKKEPEYKYYSLSEEAAARAYVWLNRIEDMPLSYEDIKSLMGDIQLKVEMTKAKEKGRYIQTIAQGSYEECNNRANSGLTTAYKEVLKHRMHGAGYEGDISDEMLDDIMKEAYGLSVPGYLAYCKVQLLPNKEELDAMYSGEAADE